MVGRQFPKDGNSDLHIVDSCGNIDQVSSWSAIGNGESIAKPIVQTRWKENMTMREFANISCRVIKDIERRNLENSVGGKLWVRYKRMVRILTLNQMMKNTKNLFKDQMQIPERS
jgi:20S proteasome alpha/beta subunit